MHGLKVLSQYTLFREIYLRTHGLRSLISTRYRVLSQYIGLGSLINTMYRALPHYTVWRALSQYTLSDEPCQYSLEPYLSTRGLMSLISTLSRALSQFARSQEPYFESYRRVLRTSSAALYASLQKGTQFWTFESGTQNLSCQHCWGLESMCIWFVFLCTDRTCQ
jgi:hypothetical protein